MIFLTILYLLVGTSVIADSDTIYRMFLQHVLCGPLDLARIEAIKRSTKGHERILKGLQEVNISFAYIVLVRSHIVLSTSKTLTIVTWLYVKETDMVW